MKTITRKKIIGDVAKKLGIDPKNVGTTINDVFEVMIQSLSKGDRFEFRDFGVFETIIRKAKVGRNPKKPEVPITIPEKRIVKFSPGKIMKSKVK